MSDLLNIKNNYSRIPNIQFTSQGGVAKSPEMSISQNENTNLVICYLESQARNNVSSAYSVSNPIYTLAFDDIENLKIVDLQGNIVQNVEFKKEGNKLTENIFVKSVNGSTLHKTIVNDVNTKSMEIVLKNKNGEIIGQEVRSYKKLDNDNAISTHNGKTYNISGLSTNVITVEHNGQKTIIDLNSKIQDTMDNFDGSPTNTNIDVAQREFLANILKKLSGDLILKFNEEIDKLVLLDFDEYEGFYRNDNGVRKLQLSSKVTDDMTFLHELGHAINALDNQGYNNDNRWCDNKNYRSMRSVEMENLRNRCSNSLTKKILNKFTNFDFERKGYSSFESAQKDASDEQFAELIGFFNCMDICKMNERTLALLQFMPASTQMVYDVNAKLF